MSNKFRMNDIFMGSIQNFYTKVNVFSAVNTSGICNDIIFHSYIKIIYIIVPRSFNVSFSQNVKLYDLLPCA